MQNVTIEVRDKKGEIIKGLDGKPEFENMTINGTAVQIKDYLSTDEYFMMTMITDDNNIKQIRDQSYALLLNTVINPKLTEKMIGALPWDKTLMLAKRIREILMPEETFLALGVELEDLPLDI